MAAEKQLQSDSDKSTKICKLSATTETNSQRSVFLGETDEGATGITLSNSWVRQNFKHFYIERVIEAQGEYLEVPIGRGRAKWRPKASSVDDDKYKFQGAAQPTTHPVTTSVRPEVAYQQLQLDVCAGCAAASAVHHFGDTKGAGVIYDHAKLALESVDALAYIMERVVNTKAVAGWHAEPISWHDPLASLINEPVVMQLVSTLGEKDHVVATVGGYFFDGREKWALPLTLESLNHCVGVRVDGAKYARVARAMRLPESRPRPQARRHSIGN